LLLTLCLGCTQDLDERYILDGGPADAGISTRVDAVPFPDLGSGPRTDDIVDTDSSASAADVMADSAEPRLDAVAPEDAGSAFDVTPRADAESTDAESGDSGGSDSASDAVEFSDLAADDIPDVPVGADVAVDNDGASPAEDVDQGDEVSEPLDVSTSDTAAPEPAVPLYLLSVNNAQKRLEKIDVLTGQGTVVCNLPSNTNYPSLTFSRDNVLFASYQGSTLHTIDPCTCAVQVVGPYGGFSGVNGITSDFGVNLFGVSHIQDEFISIDSNTGGGTSIGDLGVNFGYTGATWSDGDEMVYAIDALSDSLFKIDPETGLATYVAPLSLPMGTVGIEMHPDNGVLYACSDPAHLLSIDLVTGEVTDIGDMGQNTACNNLAAPWAPVPCLDAL